MEQDWSLFISLERGVRTWEMEGAEWKREQGERN